MKIFKGYAIRKTSTKVIFGCGAVKVNKADLVTVANAIPALKRLTKEWKKEKFYINDTHVIKIGPAKLKKLASDI